ncbi:MAG: hypothetical protein O2857_29860, partial [Planctomycetota bacterium]|nr:hypothetical protein [Planctomycetota bacterium]
GKDQGFRLTGLYRPIILGWKDHYELDEKVKHNGNRSLRTMKAGLSMAVQEGEFAREDSRPFQVAGWFRAEGRLTEAKLLVELFRDKKFWIPVTPAEEEPRETIEMAFKTAGPQWEYVSSRINPKNAVKRYRVSVIVESGGGMAWADDLVLRPLGKATAPPGQVGPLVDPFKEETGTGTDALDDAELLGAINEAANVKGNVLKNAGFEEATEGGVVTEESNHPSSYGPTDSPRTWLKSNSGNTR